LKGQEKKKKTKCKITKKTRKREMGMQETLQGKGDLKGT